MLAFLSNLLILMTLMRHAYTSEDVEPGELLQHTEMDVAPPLNGGNNYHRYDGRA